MRFIQLNSTMANFEKVTSGNKLQWYIPNMVFCDDERLALSSLVLTCSDSTPKPVLFRCPLITANYLNSDATMLSCCIKDGLINYHREALEYWPIDSSRPRFVVLTLEGASVADIEFIGVVLAVT